MIRTTIIAYLLLAAGAARADEMAMSDFSFDHVSLSVRDVEASARFYETVFGLVNITDRLPKEGVRWLSMGGGRELHLISYVEEPVEVNMAVHLGVRTSNLDHLLDVINEKHVRYTTWLGSEPGVTSRDDGTRQLYLQDPDGYWIEVIGVP